VKKAAKIFFISSVGLLLLTLLIVHLANNSQDVAWEKLDHSPASRAAREATVTQAGEVILKIRDGSDTCKIMEVSFWDWIALHKHQREDLARSVLAKYRETNPDCNSLLIWNEKSPCAGDACSRFTFADGLIEP